MCLSVVSERLRLAYLLIAKNATSTLRKELKRMDPSSQERRIETRLPGTRPGILVVCFLRDPVSRVLSGYQEISMRIEGGDRGVPDARFSRLPDGVERFEAFLDWLDAGGQDPHARPQSAYVEGLSIDLWGRVETLQRDMEALYDLLGLGSCPPLPMRRSRAGRAADYHYERHYLLEEDLPAETIDRVRRMYRADVALLRSIEVLPLLSEGGSLRGRLRDPGPGQALGARNARVKVRSAKTAADPPLAVSGVGPEGGAALMKSFQERNRSHRDCVVLRLGSRGFFAELTSVARAMVYAWCNDLQLVLDSSEFSYRRELGWSDYFVPFCAAPEEVDSARIRDTFDFHRDSGGFGRVLAHMPRVLEIGGVRLESWQEIFRTFTGLLFRPNAACTAEILRLKAGLALPERYVALHLRRGDKVGDEDGYYPTDLYLDRLEPLGDEACVFVMTDRYQAVTEVARSLARRGHHCRIASLCPEDARGFDVFALRRGEQFMTGAGSRGGAPATREYAFTETVRLLAEVVIAAEARRFVSTYRSNVGRTISFLHRDREACILLSGAEAESAGRPRPDEKEGTGTDTGDGRTAVDPANPIAESSRVTYVPTFGPPTGETEHVAMSRCDPKPAPKAEESSLQVVLHLDDEHHHTLALMLGSPELERLVAAWEARRSPQASPCLLQLPLHGGREALSFSSASLTHLQIGDAGVSGDADPAAGESPHWRRQLCQWAVDRLGVRSLLDVGCVDEDVLGLFRDRGCRVLGVRSGPGIEPTGETRVPIIEHDYTKGPCTPTGMDLVWCCGFAERVEARFNQNLLASLAVGGRYLLMTHGLPGGKDPDGVNGQDRGYWVDRMERLGFRFDPALTEEARQAAESGPFQSRGLLFVRREFLGTPRTVPDSDLPLPIHSMRVARKNEDDFYLFLDIFVHPSRRKIVAVAPHYGEDWVPEEHGVDLQGVDLILDDGLRVRGRYIPHRLDSWEPCVLFDFEHPELETRLNGTDEIRFGIGVGPHRQDFRLRTQPEPAYEVALSLVVMDENRWIGTFLEYYLNCLGADHVFVYDNRTSDRDGLLDILRPYRRRGLATYIPWSYRWRNRKGRVRGMIGQPPQQAHSLNRFANCRWIGFFDVDELLRLPGMTLREFLTLYREVPADGLSFGLRWFHYEGPLELDQIADPPLSFLHSRPDPYGRKHQKFIVDPRDVRFLRLHWLEDGKRELPIDDSEIFFHHYSIRPHRFKSAKEEGVGSTRDEYMRRFARELSGLSPAPSPVTKQPPTAGRCEVRRHLRIGQELFVLAFLPERKGTFLDLGCAGPYEGNDTALLEERGWTGLSVDLRVRHADWSRRETPYVRADVLEADLDELLDTHGIPEVVDYLSVDLDGERDRFKALDRALGGRRTFRVIRVGHDVYTGYGESERALQIRLLEGAGYERVCTDGSGHNQETFEGLWVNPALVDPARYRRFQSEGLNFTQDFEPAHLVLEQSRGRPETKADWVRHIVSAFEHAEAESSRLSGEVLKAPGLCGTYNRHFLNRLCDFDGCRYLEIGSHLGASLCSAMYLNPASAVCVDNWSQFGGSRRELEENVAKFLGRADVRVVEGDCLEIDPRTLGSFDVFYYDAQHDQDSTYRALTHYASTLRDPSVLVLDDWNWPAPRAATREALRNLDLEVLFEQEIRVPDEDLVGMPHHPASRTWWNGVGVFLVRPRVRGAP